MEFLGPVAAVLGIVVALAGIIAAGWVLTKGAIQRQTSDLWKAEAEALTARVGTLEGAQHDCLEREKNLSQRVETVERANQVLADTVSGTSAVRALGAKIEDHHREVVRILRERA